MSNLLKKDKGFTLIEIVLVLAIAGLIMVIVFLAVSGAQKSRRDTQRKNDAGRILAQLEQYASNNGGDYPSDAATTATFVTNYIATGTFKDPSTGAQYTPITYGAGATAFTVANGAPIRIARGLTCANGLLTTAAGNRVAGVQIGTEQGVSYCVDNH